MTMLNTAPNVAVPDDMYQQFIDMHDGLDDVEGMKVNAKLILLLANHIGDPDIIQQAITIATNGAKQAA